MFQVTRRRLALWYTTITAIVLLFFASGVYFYVRNTLIDRIDDTLKHVIEVIDRSLVIDRVAPSQGSYEINLEASFRNNNPGEDDHIDLELFSPSGALLWSTLENPSPIPLQISGGGKTVHLDHDNLLRQITARIEEGRYVVGYLRVSHPWFEVTKPIQQLLLDLGGGVGLMLLSVAAIGWFLSGLAMEPVRDSYQSLKQFTADASHELRNPIAMIQTNVQMALAYGETDCEEQIQRLQVIDRLTQRLGNLVNDLLFLTRSDRGMLQLNWQPVPLDALLIQVLEEQRLVAQQKGVVLNLDIVNAIADEEVFNLWGDWDQLARLFTNLISNAIAHSPESTESGAAQSVVAVTLTPGEQDRDSQLQVTIEDQGPGIDPTDLDHIFDRFYRGDLSRHYQPNASVGLGLAIAKAISDNHQGQIQVTSTPPHGTCFTVILPVTTAPPDGRDA